MSSLPPDFWHALTLLGRACERYRGTGRHAVIVGGAAVAFYTQGAVLSGDFDLVADQSFEGALLAEGFRKEDRTGHLLRGYYHLETPRYGFEIVSGALFDGRADRDKILSVKIAEDAEVLFPPVEDLIADRLAQYASSHERDGDMLMQARLLKDLALEYDLSYLTRRIIEESGDPAALGLV